MLRSLAEAPEEPTGVPEGVKDLVSRRLARLEPATVETLTAAAVLGRDFRLATLEAMVERPGEELLGPLEEALRASVVREDAEHVDRFAFAHALVRETLYDAPAQARRARLHLRAGRALEAAGAPPGELAHHFFEARDVGGAEAAVEYGAAAARRGRRARVRGGGVAPRAGAQRGTGQAGRRAELLIALGDVRWQASEPGARAAFDEAAALARSAGAPKLLARAALGAGGRFYMPTATDTGTSSGSRRRSPRSATPTARCARGCSPASPSTSRSPTPATARRELGADAVAMARRGDDEGALAAALMGRHAALLGIEHAPGAAPAHRRGARDRRAAGRARVAALALHWRIFDLVELADLAEAQRSHARLEVLARELHQPLYTHAALAWRGEWAHVAGRLDEAERIHRESLRVAEAAGATEARGFFLTQLFAVRRDQGRLGEMLEPIERLARQPGSIGVVWRAPLPLVLLQAGETERARAAYDVALAAALRGLPSSLFRLSGLVCVAEACAILGDADGAEALSSASSRTPTGSPRPRSAAAGARSGASSACSTRPPVARQARAHSRPRGTSTWRSAPRSSSPSPSAISPMYQASGSALCRASGHSLRPG